MACDLDESQVRTVRAFIAAKASARMRRICYPRRQSDDRATCQCAAAHAHATTFWISCVGVGVLAGIMVSVPLLGFVSISVCSAAALLRSAVSHFFPVTVLMLERSPRMRASLGTALLDESIGGATPEILFQAKSLEAHMCRCLGEWRCVPAGPPGPHNCEFVRM